MKTPIPMLLAASLSAAVALSGCTGSSAGFTATDESRVGDGIPSTAAQRGSLAFGAPDGCTEGTSIVLSREQGAPILQEVCGLVGTDPAGDPIYVYKGIPYADTTEKRNRWKDPQPPQQPFVRATEYGHVCPQGKGKDYSPADMGEDCLYLNVWTPAITPDGSGTRPVMVFIHGGAFISGSGGSVKGDLPNHLNLYDGAQFVATAHAQGTEVVFVTLNYRLGVLGFLADREIGATGNYGIKDQTRALEWVQRNIALFGGDPKRVTIFGESAGAQSTALHLTIQAGGHPSLFEKGVMESNYAITYMPISEARQKAESFIRQGVCKAMPLDVMACLRGLDIPHVLDEQLLGAYSVENLACAGLQALIPWNPVIDGVFITRNPVEAKWTKPVMSGSNLSESVPFLGLLPASSLEDETAYVALTSVLFGTVDSLAMRDQYRAQYPGLTSKGRFEQLVTDYMWTCFNRDLSRKAAGGSAAYPVYRYFDVHHGSFSVWDAPAPVADACSTSPAVCHADELPFVFGNATNMALEAQVFTPEEASLSQALRQTWVRFAVASDPNPASQAQWWPLDASGQVLQIQAPASATSAIDGTVLSDPANCDRIWDPVGYRVRSSFTCVVP